MATWTPETKIAAGNNNAAGLALVTALVTSPAIPFVEPRVVAHTWSGAKRVSAGTGQIRRAGFKRLEWHFDFLWIVQFKHLYDTYQSLNSGQVTIRTVFNNVTWANYNAVLDIGDIGDYGETMFEGKYGMGIPRFIAYFSRVEAI